MDDLETQLRRALEREDPPAGFADRVLRRTSRRRGFPGWMVAAAACLALVGAGYEYRWQQGQAAKRETLMALRLTSAKLRHIQSQVAR